MLDFESLDSIVSLTKEGIRLWQHRRRIGQSRFVASVVGFCRRGSQRLRNGCFREWRKFRDLPTVGQIGLSIFVVGYLPAVFWMSTSSGASAENAPDAIIAAWFVGCIAAVSVLTYGLVMLMHRRIMGLIRG